MAIGLEGLIDKLQTQVNVHTATLYDLQQKQKACDDAKSLYPTVWKKYADQLEKIQSIDFPDLYEISSGLKAVRDKAWSDAKTQIKLLQDNIKMQAKEIIELTAEVEMCGMIHKMVDEAIKRGEIEIVDETIATAVGVVDTIEEVSDVIEDIL